MTTVCNIWMICFELNWFVYGPSWILHLSEFVYLQIEVRLVAIKSTFLSHYACTPFYFSRTLPFNEIAFKATLGHFLHTIFLFHLKAKK